MKQIAQTNVALKIWQSSSMADNVVYRPKRAHFRYPFRAREIPSLPILSTSDARNLRNPRHLRLIRSFKPVEIDKAADSSDDTD
jgi:hypothetical protein